ncbi:MAG: MFS transporter [Phycisphaera sp.]|nr:MFS transporter [Phycisphaera sp.]
MPRISPASVKHTLRALRHRNYRLFYFGQGISLVGTWLQQVALAWLTYRLTNSAMMLGVVGFLGQIPVMLLGPVAGVVADHVNRRRLIMTTQALAMIQALILAWLTMSGLVEVWMIIALSLGLGCVYAFDIPTRQAFMFQLVDNRADLGNAIALNSSLVNLARMVGPAIAGVMIGLAGEGPCFLLNGVSYIAVLASLAMIQLPPVGERPPRPSMFRSMVEGFGHTFGFMPIRSLILLLSVSSVTGMAFTVLMPVFAKDVLHGDSQTLGLLMAASGLGALMGALHLAARPNVLGLGKFIPAGAALLGASILGFAVSGNVWLSAALRLTASVGIVIQMASTSTILHTITDDERRGRVMAFYTMGFIGMAPVGSLLGGTLATHVGPRITLLIVGTCTLIGAALFAVALPRIRQAVRPIYIERGVLEPDSDTAEHDA